MKNNKGILTIEASIVLTFFTMFVLFFLSFGRVYQAQSIVSHAVLQAADSISTESYLRENTTEDLFHDVQFVSNHMYGGDMVSSDSLKSLKKINFAKLAKDKFTAVVAEDATESNIILQSVGVKDGLAGVDFSQSSLKTANDETIIFARYTVELQFPLFGVKEIDLTKAAKVKNLGALTYIVEVLSDNDEHGSTSGTVKVKQNQSTVISANPEWGYKFVKWHDGNNQNPRTISNISSDKKFIAYFEKENYGVKVNYIPNNAGTASGINRAFQLNEIATVTVAPKEGYLFVGWDDDGDGIADSDKKQNSRSIKVDGDMVLTAVFKLAPSIKITYSNYSHSTDWSSMVHIPMFYSGKKINNSRRAAEINNYVSTFNLGVVTKGTNGATVKYSSNNTSVATVNSKGDVTLTGAGEAQITATVTVEGVEYKTVATLNSRRLLEHYYVSNKSGFGQRYWLSGNWDGALGNNNKSFGAHYRLLLFGDLSNQTVIHPGETTSGKASIKSTTGNNNRVMHGTNKSNDVGYVIHPGGADGDYVFFPVPEKPYALLSLTVNQ